MGQIIPLDRASQERLIVDSFLFVPDPVTATLRDPAWIVLLDRDGTIIKERQYLRDPDLLDFEERAVSAIQRLNRLGAFVAVVSNQAGLARRKMTFSEFSQVNDRFLEALRAYHAPVHAVVYCPFHENGIVPEYTCTSPFRKPGTGMFDILKREMGLRSGRVVVVGDKVSDIEFGNRLGAMSFFTTTGHGRSELPLLRQTDLRYDVAADLNEAVNDLERDPTRESNATS